MTMHLKDLDGIDDGEFEVLEREVGKLLAIWHIKNLRGQAMVFHDDQHIGEPRRELNAVQHPSVDPEKLRAFRMRPLVDSLEGNMLLHPLTTAIVEVNDDCTKARGVWWSIGIEGLSRHREQPTAIWSIGIVPGAHIVEDDEWRILSGWWQRTVKAEFHAGWVRSMVPANTRPPLSAEDDRKFLGRYAYQSAEVRQPVPEPPAKDTWEQFPDESDETWMYVNLPAEDRPFAEADPNAPGPGRGR